MECGAVSEVFTINGEEIRKLIEAHTRKTGEEVGAFLIRAILETIDRDKKKEHR
jgi:hypothetical protein